MANDVRLVCWPTPDRLGLGIQIRNLDGQFHSVSEELIQIDTGYSEDVLLPQTVFISLNLFRWQFPSSTADQGTTVTGQIIKFDEAPVDIVIPQIGDAHRVIAQTFAGNTRFFDWASISAPFSSFVGRTWQSHLYCGNRLTVSRFSRVDKFSNDI